MKIIVVGALRYSNFGDILFARLFYNQLLMKHEKKDILLYETVFNPVSEFCKKELGYRNKFKIRDLIDADVLLYISGGFFSNVFEDTLTKLLWHIRYALPGICFAKNNKRIYILGIGEGDFSWKISAKIARYILNKSTYISVRNQETAERFLGIGVTNKVFTTTDTAQVIHNELGSIEAELGAVDDSRLFLHIIPNEYYYKELKQNVFPGIKKYLAYHSNTKLVVGYDSEVKEKYMYFIEDAMKFFDSTESEKYTYTSIDGFIRVLYSCKVVVTPKLHVGIVSAALNRSVLSFPINAEKTKRYYRNIGCADRCISIHDINSDDVFAMLEKYEEQPITIPDEILRLAESNLKICDSI